MALTENEGMGTTMLVQPAGNNGGGFGGFGNDGWWIILLFLLIGGNAWGGNGNFGGNGLYPWINQTDTINGGFRDQMLNNNVTSIRDGISGISTQLCNGFAGTSAAIANGFAQAEIAANGRQMADMNTAFTAQTAMNAGFNGLQAQLAQCCCDNRLATVQTQNIVQTEGAATRLAIQNQTQQILDKLCQQEIDAKNDRIAELERQLNFANLNASQTAQTQYIIDALKTTTPTT